MELNLAMAEQFLAALSPDAAYTFQTFADGKGQGGLSRIIHGPLAARARQLAALNAKGAGVFVMVNRGDGKGRRADNVVSCRALFLDLDGAPLEPVLGAPIPPRIVVESSPGKWHAYWPVVDLPMEQFTAAQKALALQFDGDPKVHDRPRVMRLPGFIHRKNAPYLTRLHACGRVPLTWQEMADAFGLAQRMTLPTTIPAGGRNDTLFKLARSGADKGVPQSEQLKKALQVNARRCLPPLPEGEVAGVVERAYGAPRTGSVSFPHAVMDSAAYKELKDSARVLLLLAHRKVDRFSEGTFTLTWTECRDWIPREKTFLELRKSLLASGLMTVVTPPVKAMPRKGRGPEPTFFKLAIGPFSATYSTTPIPPLSATPEALQVSTIEALEGRGAQAASNRQPYGTDRPAIATDATA